MFSEQYDHHIWKIVPCCIPTQSFPKNTCKFFVALDNDEGSSKKNFKFTSPIPEC
jgi:hypothetical protein